MNIRSRTSEAFRNIFYSLLCQVVTLLLAFVSRTVFIWGFGVAYLGLNTLFSDILGLLSMADLGLGTAMTYSFYKPLAENDNARLAALVNFYRRIYIIIAVVVAAVGSLLIPFVSYIVHLDKPVEYLYLYYVLSLINVVISYLCVYRTAILEADQRKYVITQITIVFNIIKNVLQIISIVLWKNYTIYLVISIVFNLSANLYASHVTVRNYPFIKKKVWVSDKIKESVYRNLKSVFIYKISSILLNATDNILISILISTVAVGYYSNYLMIYNKLYQFFSLIFVSLIASIGNMVVKAEAKKRYEVFQCEQVVSDLLSCCVAPCFVVLINEFIVIWLGEEFVLDGKVVWAIGSNLYLACIYQPLWSYREAVGLYQKTKCVMLACAVVNIFLSLVLGYCLGLFGIFFASALSRLLTYVWIEPVLLFRDYFEKSSKGFYMNLFANFLLTVLLSVFGNYILRFFVVKNMGMWLLKAICFFLFCLVFALGVYWRDKSFKRIIDIVWLKMKK